MYFRVLNVMIMTTRRRLRFGVNDDILLLKEVVSNNPFQDDTQWNVITTNLSEITKRKFKHRTVKEHVQHLLKLFQQEDRKNLRKSSSEEQYLEKESLLQEVMNLINTNGQKKRFIINESYKRKNINEEENYAENSTSDHILICVNSDNEMIDHLKPDPLSPDSDESTVQYTTSKVSKRPKICCSQSSSFEYLQMKNEEHILLEKKKLELEQKKYELEQEKFKLEVEERRRRFEMEMKEREEAIKDKQHSRKLLDELLNMILTEKLKKN